MFSKEVKKKKAHYLNKSSPEGGIITLGKLNLDLFAVRTREESLSSQNSIQRQDITI